MSRPNTSKRQPATAGKQTTDGARRTVAAPTGPQKAAGSNPQAAQPVARTPQSAFEAHRMVASVGLVLLMLLTLFAPLSSSSTDRVPFLMPQADGTNSSLTLATSKNLESALFPYLTGIEQRQENLQSAWPAISDVLDYEPTSQEARRAIVGQIYATSGGDLETTVKESGVAANPDSATLDALSLAYGNLPDDKKSTNGLAMLNLLVSLTSSTQEIQYNREREAIYSLQQAANQDANTWQYTYNWGLASLMSGNYLSAYEAMHAIVDRDETKDVALIRFWMGLSALRMGEPDEAIRLFNIIVNAQVAPSATDKVKNAYFEARDLSLEALGDAQWARRDPATAYHTYLNTLLLGNATYGLYRKWLRLGLEQHAYEQLLADMATLSSSGLSQTDLVGRIHHDRARLLDFLGRGSEAQIEYTIALSTNGQADPPLLVSYAQSLLARGDNDGALAQAESALRQLAKDSNAGDFVSVASPALTTTESLVDRTTAQTTLNAQLVRAMAWSKQNKAGQVDSLVANITSPVEQQPAPVAGLLYLYGGYVYEAAAQAVTGDAASALYAKAAETYGKAWAKLKSLDHGQPGRAASLAGEARTIALSTGKTVTDGITTLQTEGYDPLTISPGVASDVDAGDLLYQGASLLDAAGQGKEAANAYRVAGIIINLDDAQNFSGVGRPLWMGNGTPAPASIALRTGDVLRREGGDLAQAVFRYKQAYLLSPALAPAWNNLGVLYAQLGNPASEAYLELAGKASPNYALGNHNLASAAYKAGIGNFFTAEAAQGNAIKATGPESLRWGYGLRYDERSILPGPTGPQVDFWVKVGALAILLLLLLHTLVGHDRMTNRMGLVPTRGVIGQLSIMLDTRLKTALPRLFSTGSGSSGALLLSVFVPAVVGTLGLAWSAGHGSWDVALVFVPVSFLLAILAFAANELAQRWAAGRANASTLHHIWPTGILLGIVSIPFGFMYGWQNVTRLTMIEGTQPVAEGRSGLRRARTTEESDLLYEAQAEAAADTSSVGAVESGAAAPVTITPTGGSGLFNLSPAARIMFAGAVANLGLALVFGVVYWLFGWPSMRLGLFAMVLVLAFTSVSEPPADGWTLYRRNAPLWLAVFLFAATVATLLAVGII